MTTSFADILATTRILLVCGTGGVGKTTTSVILGLAAAQQGRRTLVLTVDPARRLANALGLTAFDHEIHRVWESEARTTSHAPRGSLDCMMLDAKRTFDRVVERYAPDATTAHKILHNPLYQQLSSMIAGSQEYMAMEQLYEIVQSTAYDLIILDTPPTHQALDFFRAPLRMVNALSGSMLKLFLKPTLAAGKWGAALLARGTNKLLRVFGNLTGAEMLHEISELVLSAVSLLGGFEARAQAVNALLRSPDAGIVLVTIPVPELIADGQQFLRESRKLGMHIRGVILNRTMPEFENFPPEATVSAELAPLYRLAEQCRQRHAQEARLRKTLIPRGAKDIAVHNIPERSEPMNSVEELRAAAQVILHATTVRSRS